MTEKQPTQEQIQKFWEHFGFSLCGSKEIHFGWAYPDIEVGKCFIPKPLPPIDLNNLFKYAVPKLSYDIRFGQWADDTWSIWLIENEHTVVAEGNDKDPALALFCAIWEVIKRWIQ